MDDISCMMVWKDIDFGKPLDPSDAAHTLGHLDILLVLVIT